MRYRVRHTTHYDYSSPVTLSHNEARLLMRDVPGQSCTHSELMISPPPLRQRERRDFFGNRVVYFAIQDIHHNLEVTASSEITTQPKAPPPSLDLTWETAAAQLRPGRERASAPHGPECLEASLFNMDSPFIRQGPALRAFAQQCFTPGRPMVEAVLALNTLIFEEFTYDPEFSTLATPLADVLANRKGVCQDFAHLAIGALRSIGLAARYVSGYLETLPPPGQERLVGADASHAWLSVYLPGWGWLDIDPTNSSTPDERYLTLAWGRDYGDVTPLKGVMNGGGAHDLKVSVDVMPQAAD
ncbi:MAG: transglutaminase family protein [Natronospirillum sp.]|uniref:transglutaminase family protein n=1 Tax=Natronospirillum sp. TaxID=2812955 RepID=UPI0025DEB35A|nr:transglutaminase family protein [Natronospirillum sp.]MCH8552977.1 transglutaminase family protein [Natronospirillum sp.]